MQLSLSSEEAQALEQALDTYLKELDFELVRTEKHPLQHALHMRFNHLQAIQNRLRQSAGMSGEQALEGSETVL